MPDSTFSPARLRQLREAAGLMQWELANLADCYPHHISQWETGKVRPERRTVQRLAQALGVSVEALAAPRKRKS